MDRGGSSDERVAQLQAMAFGELAKIISCETCDGFVERYTNQDIKQQFQH